MLKQKEYNIADTNIANLGSDLEKKVRQAAAETEAAWKEAGKNVGLQIWRIEKFKVISWPREQYGQFYSGDSYIVLNTYKKKDSPKILWDVHFWLGKYTTQDEAGTAAYKTVELDDLLGGDPVQHREVQGYESDLFLSYFKNEIRILDGGVDTGFKHVEAEKYRARLLQLKGKRKIRVQEVELSSKSLNSGDVFIVDAGMNLYQFNGKKAAPAEKAKGGQLCMAIKDERKGLPKILHIEEGQKDPDAVNFWKILGGEGPIKSAEEGGSDEEAEKAGLKIKKLLRLSDASGKLTMTEVATGTIKKNMLDTNDVFILDNGAEVFAWIGRKTTKAERKGALQYAQDYLAKFNRPFYLPISRILEGGENEVFEASFDG
jgi:gelsolin